MLVKSSSSSGNHGFNVALAFHQGINTRQGGMVEQLELIALKPGQSWMFQKERVRRQVA
jgi:hypothetical protein